MPSAVAVHEQVVSCTVMIPWLTNKRMDARSGQFSDWSGGRLLPVIEDRLFILSTKALPVARPLGEQRKKDQGMPRTCRHISGSFCWSNLMLGIILPSARAEYYITLNQRLRYIPFCADFGPYNLGTTYHVTSILRNLLKNPLYRSHGHRMRARYHAPIDNACGRQPCSLWSPGLKKQQHQSDLLLHNGATR